MPDLDPITGARDRSSDRLSRPQAPSHARNEKTTPESTGGGRATSPRSELEQIGHRFEVARRHPFHSADRNPARVEELRRRGRRLLEKQAQHVERQQDRQEEPDGFSLTHLRDRLVGTVRSLLTRQKGSPASRRPTR